MVIVNSIIIDGPTTKEMPPGHVRGFIPVTGEVEFSFTDEIARTESKIRENPLLSVGIAAAAGLVIGLLLNRNQ